MKVKKTNRFVAANEALVEMTRGGRNHGYLAIVLELNAHCTLIDHVFMPLLNLGPSPGITGGLKSE